MHFYLYNHMHAILTLIHFDITETLMEYCFFSAFPFRANSILDKHK